MQQPGRHGLSENTYSTSHELIEQAILKGAEMGPDAKQDRSRQRIREIHRAAIKVIARNGIAGSRIAEIAEEAAVMPSSVYDYYKSKEELAYSIPTARLAEFYQVYQTQVERVTSPKERLIQFLLLTAEYACLDPDWSRLYYLEVWPSVHLQNSELRETVNAFARIVVAMLREGEEAGEWTCKGDPYMIADILIGSLVHMITTWLLFRKPRNLRRKSKQLIELLMRFIDTLEAEEG